MAQPQVIDHDMTPDPVCPWCGAENGQAAATVHLTAICESCGLSFTVDRHTAYSTEKLEADDAATD